jgi:hypothetical protein
MIVSETCGGKSGYCNMRKAHARDSVTTEASVSMSSHYTCHGHKTFNCQANRKISVTMESSKMSVQTELRSPGQLASTVNDAGLRSRGISAWGDIADTSGVRKAERVNAASIELPAAQLAVIAVFEAKMTRKANRSSNSRCSNRRPDKCL